MAVVVAIVRIIIPSISVRISQPEEYAAAEPTKFAATEPAAMEAAKSGVEPAAMKPAAMKPTKSAAAETATAVETATPATAATPAMPSVGEIWLAERGSAQQSICDYQGPSHTGPGLMFD